MDDWDTLVHVHSPTTGVRSHEGLDRSGPGLLEVTERVWLRRAYDPPTRNDGYRVLVDRIWPRGVSKDELQLDQWNRDLAPTADLRKWFGHDPSRWTEFRDRYRAELEQDARVLDGIVEHVKRGRVTLVYGARDQEHNNAVVLREVIEEVLAAEV